MHYGNVISISLWNIFSKKINMLLSFEYWNCKPTPNVFIFSIWNDIWLMVANCFPLLALFGSWGGCFQEHPGMQGTGTDHKNSIWTQWWGLFAHFGVCYLFCVDITGFHMIISFSTGMNKMVINHLEKLFVTNDAATILRELEVNNRPIWSRRHSCARIVVAEKHW